MDKKEIKQLHKEFGIHFKNSPSELKFLEVLIDDLIKENYQKDMMLLYKNLNRQCAKALTWQKKEIKKGVEKIMRDTLSADTPIYHREVDEMYHKLEKL